MLSANPPSKVRKAVYDYVQINAKIVPGYELLSKYGRWWYNDGRVHEEGFGQPNECFYNVYSYANQTYCGTAAYGIAVAENIPLALPHAWRVMPRTDIVYELTPSWNTPTWYCGILISDTMLMEICHHNTPACQDVLGATANRWIESKDSSFPDRFEEHVKLLNEPQTDHIIESNQNLKRIARFVHDQCKLVMEHLQKETDGVMHPTLHFRHSGIQDAISFTNFHDLVEDYNIENVLNCVHRDYKDQPW